MYKRQPQRKINEIKVSGRNGVLHEDEKTYQNYTKDAECHVMDRSQIDEVCGWLTGFGEVIFSSEPDKVYRAYIKNQIEFGSILKNINDFLVQFDVEPFKYSVNAAGDALESVSYTHLDVYKRQLMHRLTVWWIPQVSLLQE